MGILVRELDDIISKVGLNYAQLQYFKPVHYLNCKEELVHAFYYFWQNEDGKIKEKEIVDFNNRVMKENDGWKYHMKLEGKDKLQIMMEAIEGRRGQLEHTSIYGEIKEEKKMGKQELPQKLCLFWDGSEKPDLTKRGKWIVGYLGSIDDTGLPFNILAGGSYRHARGITSLELLYLATGDIKYLKRATQLPEYNPQDFLDGPDDDDYDEDDDSDDDDEDDEDDDDYDEGDLAVKGKQPVAIYQYAIIEPDEDKLCIEVRKKYESGSYSSLKKGLYVQIHNNPDNGIHYEGVNNEGVSVKYTKDFIDDFFKIKETSFRPGDTFFNLSNGRKCTIVRAKFPSLDDWLVVDDHNNPMLCTTEFIQNAIYLKDLRFYESKKRETVKISTGAGMLLSEEEKEDLCAIYKNAIEGNWMEPSKIEVAYKFDDNRLAVAKEMTPEERDKNFIEEGATIKYQGKDVIAVQAKDKELDTIPQFKKSSKIMFKSSSLLWDPEHNLPGEEE